MVNINTIIETTVHAPDLSRFPMNNARASGIKNKWQNYMDNSHRGLSLDKFCDLVNEFVGEIYINKQALHTAITLFKTNIRNKLQNRDELSGRVKKILWSVSLFSNYSYPDLIEIVSKTVGKDFDVDFPPLPQTFQNLLDGVAIAPTIAPTVTHSNTPANLLVDAESTMSADNKRETDYDELDLKLHSLLKDRKWISKKLMLFCLDGNYDMLSDVPAEDITGILFEEEPVPQPITYALLPDLLGISIEDMIIGLRSH